MPKVIREYHIDLAKPASTRWNKMIEAERSRGRSLVKNCLHEAKLVAGPAAVKAARILLPKIYRSNGGFYKDDIDAWAAGLEVEPNDLLLANLTYELAQAGVYFASMASPVSNFYKQFKRTFGFCTAAAYNLPGSNSVIHVRNMDWPLTTCGTATCLIHYHGKKGPFTSIGWPGYIGVLSGVAKGRFSATINQAPQIGRPTANWPSAFALRWNFENSDSFQEVVSDLKSTKMAASTLFMVAGTQNDQAMVIEHTGSKTGERSMKKGALALANHFEVEAFESYNNQDLIEFSKERRRCAHAFAQKPTQTLSLLDSGPACHELSCQFMAMDPRTGRYKVFYQDTDNAVAELYEEKCGAEKAIYP